jgi:hypothetical protein
MPPKIHIIGRNEILFNKPIITKLKDKKKRILVKQNVKKDINKNLPAMFHK